MAPRFFTLLTNSRGAPAPKRNKAVIDIVKWDGDWTGDPGPHPRARLYAWKFDSDQLATWTQLIVAESQEAVLVHGGQMEGPFGPGRHTLSTENLPLLRTLIGLPFGGRSPFTAEVWFVNRTTPLDVLWGTTSPLLLQDPLHKIMLPVRAHGQYGVTISDTKKFLIKLVGPLKRFDEEHLRNYFRGVMVTRVKDIIARTILQNKVSILEISMHLNELSAALQQQIAVEMAEFGLQLVNFFVNSIDTPDDDPAVQRLRSALAKRAEMDIVGYDYRQERSYDALQAAASNTGQAGAMMGAGIGMGLGVGVGTPLGQAMGQVAQQLQTGPATQPPLSGSTVGANQGDARIAKLRELAQLHKQGVLTEAEFVAEKKKILDN
jgi:membrane protease subunit (stomatin/prohibitin family)